MQAGIQGLMGIACGDTNCFDAARPAGGLLSCRDKKVTKETPTRSLRRLFEPVPCAPPLKPGAAQLARIRRRFGLRQCSRTAPA